MDVVNFDGVTRDNIGVSGALLKSLNQERQHIEVILTPIKHITQVEIRLAIQGNKKLIPFRVKLDLSGSKPHKKNADILVELAK